MRTLYDVPAPAKLNLFLHITGRRSDGYHLLQSVFMLIDWQDQLHFERTANPTISRSDLASTTALPADDLCVRAARALDIPMVGLDLMVPAADQPEYVFIEANERAGLANHEPQPTAERFVDLLFPHSQPAT